MNDKLINELRSSDLKPTFGEMYTYIQKAELLYSLLNTEGKRKIYISLIYTKTSQHM